MPEMGVASVAAYFGAAHEQRIVFMFGDRMRVGRSKEAWPAGAGVEFGIGVEKRCIAADTTIDAVSLIIVIGMRKSALGSMHARDVKLLRSQLLAPFVVRFDDLWL